MHRCRGGRRLSGDASEHGADADVGTEPAGGGAPQAAPAPAAPTAAAPAKPVQETEAVVGDASSRTAAPIAKSDAAKPAEPQTRAPRAPRENHPARQPWRVTSNQPPRCRTWPRHSRRCRPLPAPVEAAPRRAARRRARAQEPVRAPEPPARTFEELVVSSDSVIGFQTETRVSSETARVEDRVEGRVTRDVRVGDRVAIPAGTKIIGSVMQVDRGGKVKERAHLGIRFHTLVLADGTRAADLDRDDLRATASRRRRAARRRLAAPRSAARSSARFSAAARAWRSAPASALARAAAAVAASDRNAATLPAGTAMTVRILQPITVTTEGK